MADFESDRNKLAAFNVYATFLTSMAGGGYAVVNKAAHLDYEKVVGMCFVDTNAVVLGAGLLVILGRSVHRNLRRFNSPPPAP